MSFLLGMPIFRRVFLLWGSVLHVEGGVELSGFQWLKSWKVCGGWPGWTTFKELENTWPKKLGGSNPTSYLGQWLNDLKLAGDYICSRENKPFKLSFQGSIGSNLVSLGGIWVVVWNISLSSSQKLENRSRLTNIFQMGWYHQLVRITPLGKP